jgi:ubiquitin carboxyl-terminal hydrolase 9/13
VVKNDETGKWMLIDDEAVEAVDDGFVGRFYGDRPGMASAYVLFYQQVDSKLNQPVDAEIYINGKPTAADVSLTNGVSNLDLSEKTMNGHSSQPSVDSLCRVPSSPATSRLATRIPSLATVEEKPTNPVTPPTSPLATVVTPPSAVITPSKSPLQRTPTKKELKDAAKREKEERKEREKREKEEGKREKEGGTKLGRSLGTIKRWGKDKS